MLGDINKLFVFKSLLTTPSNVLPLHLKQTFRHIIWIFIEGEGDGIETKLPFKIFSTLTYPKDCSTALIKQVLPRFLNPTKFLRASFFLIAELLLLFGPVDDLKLFLLLFPFPLVPSLLFRDFLIAGWFSTPLKTKLN